MEFYNRSTSDFAREYGLMPVFVTELGPDSPARRIFLAKLAAIHDTRRELEMRKAERNDG